uniref:EH domain-containing protein n=2 Tax=Gossypium raimondii TaxID=29730 RepID=A0A0D2QKS1_GOSRA|nr:hypothetical protein B456_003G001700 [Gossypium raimondii]
MILTWLISDLVAWRWRDIPNNTDLFVAYFRNARSVEPRLLPFFKAPIWSQNALSQVLMHADQQTLGYLGRQEFYNALKFVTVAQSKRDLTPDMINAALYGPASAKIPAPQINLATVPTPQSNLATLGTPGLGNVGVNHQHLQSQQNQVMRPTQAMPSIISSQTEQVLAAQGMLMGGNIVAPRLPTSNSSINWQSRNSGGLIGGANNQVHSQGIGPSTSQDGFGQTSLGLTLFMQPRPLATPRQISSTTVKRQDMPSSQLTEKDPKELVASGKGFVSDSFLGDFSATSLQSKQLLWQPHHLQLAQLSQ